jgi:hypothetical protein
MAITDTDQVHLIWMQKAMKMVRCMLLGFYTFPIIDLGRGGTSRERSARRLCVRQKWHNYRKSTEPHK